MIDDITKKIWGALRCVRRDGKSRVPTAKLNEHRFDNAINELRDGRRSSMSDNLKLSDVNASHPSH